MQAWQHAEDMKKRIVSNAMCSWAEAVALSAGEDIDVDRTSCSQASVKTFQQLRKVISTPHQLAALHMFQTDIARMLKLCAPPNLPAGLVMPQQFFWGFCV